MNINTAELVEALAKVKPGLSTKEFIEQTTSFAFMGDRVVTYNDEISISHPINELNIRGAIEAEPLYALLAKITRETIRITVKGKELLIRAGKLKAGMQLQQEIKLPLEEIADEKKWKKIPDAKAFIKGLEFVSFTCSKDLTRPVLTCVNVTRRGEVQATDMFRASTYDVGKVPVKDFLIPVAAVRALSKFKVEHIAQTPGWIHFKTKEGTEFSARTFTGDFPDVSKHLSIEGYDVVFPTTMAEMVERSLVFTKKDILLNSSVEIVIGENKAIVKGKDACGWFEESANIEYEGESLAFLINPLFLMDIVQEKKYTSTLSEDGAVILFEAKAWKHLVSLHREC